MKIDGNTTLDQLAEHFHTTMPRVLVALAQLGPAKTISRRILSVMRCRTTTATSAEIVRMVDPSRHKMVTQRLAYLASTGQLKRTRRGTYSRL